MKSYLLTTLFIMTFSQVKSQIALPMIWLKADSQSLNHRNFRDVGNLNGTIGFHGTGAAPDSVGFNYNPALYFNGQSKVIDINFLNGIKKNPTFLVVYKADTSDQKYGIFSLKQDTSLLILLTTQSVKQKNSELVYADSTNINSTVNVLSHNLKDIGSSGQRRNLLIGTDEQNKLQGKIAEVIVFNNRINNSQRRRYETYLALKFSVTLDGTDYHNSLDTCIWKKQDNEVFHFDVAGIGKDSSFALDQKQSSGQGGNDIVGIAANKFAPSNFQNTAQIPEGYFLIWGHSNFAVTDVRKDTVQFDSVVVHLKRAYRVRRIGDSSLNVPTQVVFHTNDYTGYEGPFIKLSRAYNTADIILFPDSTDANGSVYFSNLYWDIDGSGYDEFTFGFQNEISQIPLNSESMLASTNTDLLSREARSMEGENWDDLESEEIPNSNSKSKLFAKVYPNPTLGPFNLAVITSTTESTDIICYDYAGRVVLQHEVKGNTRYLIDHLQLAKGHYFLVVQNPAGRKVLNLFIYE